MGQAPACWVTASVQDCADAHIKMLAGMDFLRRVYSSPNKSNRLTFLLAIYSDATPAEGEKQLIRLMAAEYLLCV
jgi:hypothetical protein